MFLRNLIFLLFTLTALARSSSADELVLKQLDSFLSDHCFECHDDLTTEGDLDLTSVSFDLTSPADFGIWDLVYQRVKSGEMPPEDEPQPDAAAKEAFLKSLHDPLMAADQADLEKYGRVHGRRLTRVEYEHTLHDLLGIDIPLANMLPADDSGHGFETNADSQQLSHFHLDKYLTAADAALDEAFARAIRGDKTYKKTLSPKDLTHRTAGNYRGPEARNGKTIAWKMSLQFTGRMPKTTVPESGWYRVTMKNLKGINRGSDGVVWGSLRSGACSSAEPILYYVASVEAGEKLTTQSFDAWIQKGHMLEFKPNEGTDKNAPTGATGGNVSYEGRDLAKDGFAGISFDSITMERIYPNAKQWGVRQKLWNKTEFKQGKPVVENPSKELERLLPWFATRAFRRPVTKEQVEPYFALASAKLEKSGNLAQALQVGYRAILCSPRFLSFVEAPGELDDYALASRLSYFLWDSIPDAELWKAASSGQLSQPKVLAAQLNRMLEDPKSDRFIASFTDQWLNLKEIDFTTPDPRRFGVFDPILQDSMVQETRAFVAELIRKDLGAKNLISSDFAMLNTRLKSHYYLKDAKLQPGGGLQRVSLPETARSGLVTQASVLKVTADGSVTSPILRGIWVNERILGKETPPPPPNVPAVEPDIRGATSIRDQLAKHSSDKACASCHAKIDPAGFALESYDPVGQWRQAYGPKKTSAKVDSSGVTPEGVPFKNIGDWKQIYTKQPELLAGAFAKQLLAYATGAPTRFSDDDYLNQILASSKKSDYGLGSILRAAVASPIFLNK